MDIKDFRVLARRVREDAALLRKIVEKETSDARLLIDRDLHREFGDYLLEIGNDIAVAESKWRYFGLTVNGKMAVQRSAQV